MTFLKKLVLKRPAIARKFKQFKRTVKNVKHLENIVKSDGALRKMIKKVFSKRGIKVAGIATAVGVGAHYINDYIQSNSGCFVISGSSVCKVKNFSCCQPSKVDNVPFCLENPDYAKTCDGFDEDEEKSCCRLCDCNNYNCLPHQTMECRRPTIGEALSFYAKEATSSLLGFVNFLFPWLYWMFGAFIACISIWLAWKFYNRITKNNDLQVSTIKFTQ